MNLLLDRRNSSARLLSQPLGTRRDAWLTYIEDANFVDSLALGVRLCSEVLVDILEVRNCDILLKFLVEDDVVVDELNLSRQVLQGACSLY